MQCWENVLFIHLKAFWLYLKHLFNVIKTTLGHFKCWIWHFSPNVSHVSVSNSVRDEFNPSMMGAFLTAVKLSARMPYRGISYRHLACQRQVWVTHTHTHADVYGWVQDTNHTDTSQLVTAMFGSQVSTHSDGVKRQLTTGWRKGQEWWNV